MALVRRLGSLAPLLLLLAFSPVSDAEALEGTWVLDLKASQDVLEAQKAVDLRISLKGNVLTVLQEVGGKTVGTRQIFVLDGRTRQLDTAGGQTAQVETDWLVRGTKMKQVVRIPIAGSPVPAVQTTQIEVSPDGQTLTKLQTLEQAGQVTERRLVYRRK